MLGSANEARITDDSDLRHDSQEHWNIQRFRGFVDGAVVPAIAGDHEAQRVMVTTIQRWFTHCLGGERVPMR